MCETTKRIDVLRRTLRAVPGLAAYLRDDLPRDDLPGGGVEAADAGGAVAEEDGQRGEADGQRGEGGQRGEAWVERAGGPRVWLDTSLACVMLHDMLVGSRWLDSRP